MDKTIRDVEEQIEKNTPEILKNLGLLPQGYRCRARLHGKSRDKRRTATFEKNWSPDTDSIVIEFEPDLEAGQQVHQQYENIRPASGGNPHHQRPLLQGPLEAPNALNSSAVGMQNSSQQKSQLQTTTQAGMGPRLDQATPSSGTPTDPVSDLVRALDRAESRPGYAFIALKWFRDTALITEGLAWANVDSARQDALRSAIDQRLILTSKVANPKSPQFPVTAIRLNRLMPQVKAILEIPEGGSPDFTPVSIRGENLSATILRDRR